MIEDLLAEARMREFVSNGRDNQLRREWALLRRLEKLERQVRLTRARLPHLPERAWKRLPASRD